MACVAVGPDIAQSTRGEIYFVPTVRVGNSDEV
jgi:hypothetical protein